MQQRNIFQKSLLLPYLFDEMISIIICNPIQTLIKNGNNDVSLIKYIGTVA